MHITPASGSEQTELPVMIQEMFEETPKLIERCNDFTTDRGLDSGKTKALLWDDYAFRPVIDIREMWGEEKSEPGYAPVKPITCPLYPSRCDTIVYTEKRTVHCVCPATGEPSNTDFQGECSDARYAS